MQNLKCVIIVAIWLMPVTLFAQEEINLTGQWYLTTGDTVRNSLVSTSTANWQQVQMPGNIGPAGVYWIRKNFSAEPSRFNYAFECGPVIDYISVYINGESIVQASNPVMQRAGRPVLLTIPGNLLVEGSNTIAIRIQSVSPLYTGIAPGSFSIRTIEGATSHYYRAATPVVVFAVTFLSIAIFFLMLYRKNQLRDYLLCAMGCIIAGLTYLFGSEVTAKLSDGASLYFYPFFASILPVIFYPFLFQKIQQKPGYMKLVYLAAGLVALLSAATAIFFTTALSRLLLISWQILTIPLALYAGFLLIRYTLNSVDFEGIVLSAGFLLLTVSILYSFVNGKFFIPLTVSDSVLLGAAILSAPVSLLFRTLLMQKEAEAGETKMQAVDTLQTMIFHHIDTAIANPVLELTEQINQKEQFSEKEYQSVEYRVHEIEEQLNNILELSRLEVMEGPEARVEMNVKDFLDSILPHTDITYTMRVDSDLIFETSLELVNSLVMRLVGFPGFQSFQHIDLIITSDLNQNLHFRFLMQQSEMKTVKRMYSILTNKMPDIEGLWVEWSIIQEIIRILNGELEVKILNKKFLCVDITLPAHRVGSDEISETPEVSISIASNKMEPIDSIEEFEEKSEPIKKARKQPEVQFSPNMTPSEFVEWVKQKFKKAS